jgi:alpha-mannosidase
MRHLIKRLKNQIDTTVGSFHIEGGVTDEPVTFDKRESLTFKEYKIGDSWGELFSCGWFHLTGKIEPSITEPVYLKLDMNCEALLYNSDGVPLKGFTNGSSAFGFMGHLGDPGKYYYPLAEFTTPQGDVELWLDAGMNDLFGNVKKKGRIEIVEMVIRDRTIRELYYDLTTLHSLKLACIKEDRQAYRIYSRGLRKAAGIIRSRNGSWKADALAVTAELLKTESKANHEISSIGHAHLDLAWLWPVRESYRKGARTFANALRMMDDYEDFHFGASQPQLYEWVKNQYPGLYKQIKERVAQGRWEVQGGMWVEADTNVSGEEALVRQMLYGIRFYQEEFGIRVKSLWLPDVFGYSGNMPQIIKKSGLDYFMTIKISWNDTNKFPHHSFNWKGIDGSQVFAHMPPEGEYNSPANVYFLLKSMKNYREKHLDNRTLNLFGVGDGGGGPAPSHMERLRRLNGPAPMAKVKIEPSWKFFEKLAGIIDNFPVFKGELYLEKHRGTYTSQGRVKYFNRRMEQKLKTLETLLVQTDHFADFKEELQTIWKEVLLYQFHDILPGSSIKRVYNECLARYEILDRRIDAITAEICNARLISSKEEISADRLSVYNPLPVRASSRRISGSEYQVFEIEPLSNVSIEKRSWTREPGKDARRMANKHIEILFKRDGSIASIQDRTTENQVLRGAANKLTVYTDIANAWDIFRYYRLLPKRKMQLIKSESFSYGPVQEIVQHYSYGKSSLVQTIRLEPDSHRIDFRIKADWQSNRTMLRTAFPLTINSDKAVYDIQFGSLERVTTNKNKVERAQYEACGHNWADLNDGNRGAALFTDSKYGFRIKNNTIDLNLIKSTNHPAKEGDMGEHQMAYSLYIHKGDHIEARVDEKAMEFNTWMPVMESEFSLGSAPFKLDNNNITYSTLKESEDRNDLILRLYERNGRDETCLLKTDKDTDAIYETNMVEENPVVLSREDSVFLSFKPFEVKTIKIGFKKKGDK